MVADLSLAPTIGQLGTPLVDVLATPVDASSGEAVAAVLVRPRYGEEVFVSGAATAQRHGHWRDRPGGWVRIVGGSGGDVIGAGRARTATSRPTFR